MVTEEATFNLFQPGIYNEDCITGARLHISDKCVDLIICDPPFGIKEDKFGGQYGRDNSKIIDGYVPAPKDYYKFSLEWLTECKRILKDDGSMYVVTGFTHMSDVSQAIQELGMHVRNHICWKYQFGVNTTRKFVTSHYSILYVTKSENAAATFNKYCRYTEADRNENGESLLKIDQQDFWAINKVYKSGKNKLHKFKNINTLPEALILKMIQYSSNPGDLVCDFFMGGFTTANVARKMGRHVCGFELNKNAYDFFLPQFNQIEFGGSLISGVSN